MAGGGAYSEGEGEKGGGDEGEGGDIFWLRRMSKFFGYWGDSPYPFSRKNPAYNVECMK